MTIYQRGAEVKTGNVGMKREKKQNITADEKTSEELEDGWGMKRHDR